MGAILHSIAVYIAKENKTLTKELLKQAIKQLNLRLTDHQIEKHYEFLQQLLNGVSVSLLSTNTQTEAMNLEYDLDNFFFKDGTLLKETIEILSTFRLSLISELERNGLLKDINSADMSLFYNRIIYVFDDAIRNTTINFNQENKKVIDAIEKEILELSAPIVPIKNGVAVLPLIGDFSNPRAAHILNEVIPKISQLDLEILVLDFSGIHSFDTFVAQKIFQIKDLLNLLDIQPVITGIRPSIAQTAVNLGIDIKDLQTYNTVKQFLDVLNKQ